MRSHSKLLTMFIVLGTVTAALSVCTKAANEDEFDVKTLAVLWERSDGHNATLWSVRWSPDGKMISTTFFDNATVVWNATTGKRIVKLGAHSNYTSEVDEGTRCGYFIDCQLNKTNNHWPSRVSAWSPDGKYLAVGGDNKLIIIYETTDWTIHKVLSGHEGSVLTVQWSPDGTKIASGSGTDKVEQHNTDKENVVRIWDFAAGVAIANLTGHKDAVMEVKWSQDSARLVSADDKNSLKIWETSTWDNTLNLTGHTIGVLSVDWSPNGTMLVSGSRDYTIILWNSSSGDSQAMWASPNCVRSVDWHPNGELIAASGPAESQLKIRNATTGSIMKTLDEAAVTGSDVMSVRWSPDGKMLAAGAGNEHTLRIYAFGIGTVPPPPLIPEWMPGTILYFAVSVVGTFLIVWLVASKLREKRKKEVQ